MFERRPPQWTDILQIWLDMAQICANLCQIWSVICAKFEQHSPNFGPMWRPARENCARHAPGSILQRPARRISFCEEMLGMLSPPPALSPGVMVVQVLRTSEKCGFATQSASVQIRGAAKPISRVPSRLGRARPGRLGVGFAAGFRPGSADSRRHPSLERPLPAKTPKAPRSGLRPAKRDPLIDLVQKAPGPRQARRAQGRAIYGAHGGGAEPQRRPGRPLRSGVRATSCFGVAARWGRCQERAEGLRYRNKGLPEMRDLGSAANSAKHVPSTMCPEVSF